MAINIKKSCCLWIGPRADVVYSNITCLSGLSLNWVNEISFTFHYWQKSFIIYDVKLAELSKNSFERKNVIF